MATAATGAGAEAPIKARSANSCNFMVGSTPACSAQCMPVTVIPACAHCKKQYCTSHLLPEVHGCRLAAQNEAQLQASAEAIRVREAKRQHDTQDARKKLEAKRAELAKERSKKGK